MFKLLHVIDRSKIDSRYWIYYFSPEYKLKNVEHTKSVCIYKTTIMVVKKYVYCMYQLIRYFTIYNKIIYCGVLQNSRSSEENSFF